MPGSGTHATGQALSESWLVLRAACKVPRCRGDAVKAGRVVIFALPAHAERTPARGHGDARSGGHEGTRPAHAASACSRTAAAKSGTFANRSSNSSKVIGGLMRSSACPRKNSTKPSNKLHRNTSGGCASTSSGSSTGRSLRLKLQPGEQQGRFLRMLRHRKEPREGPTEARGTCKHWKGWWGGYSTVAWRASPCRRSESQAEESSPLGSKIQERGGQTQRYGRR